MALTLHTDSSTLTRSDLPQRYRDAIDRARRLQTGRKPLDPDIGEIIDLGEGVGFLPDGADRVVGMFATIASLLAIGFGLAFAGIALDGEQSRPWMAYAAPALLAVGIYLFWTGRRHAAQARAEPRLSGAFLSEEGMVYVSPQPLGCRTFPIGQIRRFQFQHIPDSPGRLYVHYVDHHDQDHRELLCGSDLHDQLNEWLAEQAE